MPRDLRLLDDDTRTLELAASRQLRYIDGMLEPAKLRELIEQQFPDAQIEIDDLTGTKDHFDVSLGSDRFVGLSPLAQHRLVYEALGSHMRGDIHALALHTYTLDAWKHR